MSAITIQEITDRVQWNDFLTRQVPGHLLQSYEWGELSKYLGGCIHRLCALDGGRLVGAMLLLVVPVPLSSGYLNWLYCSRGPTVEGLDSPALTALLECAHKIARQERAVVLRIEPNIADDDPVLERWLAIYHKHGFRSNPISVHGRRSWVLDIHPSAAQLLSEFKTTWGQNV